MSDIIQHQLDIAELPAEKAKLYTTQKLSVNNTTNKASNAPQL